MAGCRRRSESKSTTASSRTAAVPLRRPGYPSWRRWEGGSPSTGPLSLRPQWPFAVFAPHPGPALGEGKDTDRIAIIDTGTIVALDTPEALKASVGRVRVQIQTPDDQAAIVALRRGRRPRILGARHGER